MLKINGITSDNGLTITGNTTFTTNPYYTQIIPYLNNSTVASSTNYCDSSITNLKSSQNIFNDNTFSNNIITNTITNKFITCNSTPPQPGTIGYYPPRCYHTGSISISSTVNSLIRALPNSGTIVSSTLPTGQIPAGSYVIIFNCNYWTGPSGTATELYFNIGTTLNGKEVFYKQYIYPTSHTFNVSCLVFYSSIIPFNLYAWSKVNVGSTTGRFQGQLNGYDFNYIRIA
jgi:hypothetical protein